MIVLKPIDQAFLLKAVDWFQNREVIGNDLPLLPWTGLALAEHFHKLDGITWAIWSGDGPIGWVTINSVDHYHKSGEIHLRLGERRLGSGIAAAAKAMDYAFRELGLHSIHTRRDTSRGPDREDWRFWKVEGTLRESVRVPVWDEEKKTWTDSWGDAKIYGITREEFYQSDVFGRYLDGTR